MRQIASMLVALAALWTAPVAAREVVDASDPQKLSVTIYRDPDRFVGDPMDTDMPQGFAMISETRTVTLPPGESTIRFTGVAEGMVAVTAIVTGLPGGTIEKNRNADLLSPAALVDGTLGNRVRITRTNPGSGTSQAEEAIIRTRADGGLVLQTREGYEAVRCSGLPEGLSFDRVPAGLSAKPVFSIDTRSQSGGTYTVTLTYLAWGFDWSAHYVATLAEQAKRGKVKLRLMSWLTLLNDNGQSFPDAELMAVAGTINVESDYEGLADPPAARPLRLQCYPIGSTAAGSPVPNYEPGYPPPPPAPMAMYDSGEVIMVTAQRREAKMMNAPVALAVMAQEEQLGDLKLYRIPEPVTVNAKGLKQVAFLDKGAVEGEFLYTLGCDPWDEFDDEPVPTSILFATKNDAKHGLGAALPTGGFTLFEPSRRGDLLVGEQFLRDYAVGQDVELDFGESRQVMGDCSLAPDADEPDDRNGKWSDMSVLLTNANNHDVTVRLVVGAASEWEVKGLRGLRVKDGEYVAEITVRSGTERRIVWKLRLVPEVEE